jgi:SM-20-related protein
VTRSFRLNDGLDKVALAASFAANGFVSVREFIDYQSATQLHQALQKRQDWRLAVNAGDMVYDLDYSAMSVEQKAELEERITESARNAFQFRFSSIRVPDAANGRATARELRSALLMHRRPLIDRETS